MKIAVITDTHNAGHLKPEWERAIERQSREIKETEPDLLIHLGDVGESVEARNDFFRLYNSFPPIPKFVIPGNHDFWSDPYPGIENWERMKSDAEENGWYWLPDGPILIGMRKDSTNFVVGVVGQPMGFDGSYYPMGRDRAQMQLDWQDVNDGQFTRFPQHAEKDPWRWYERQEALLQVQLLELLTSIEKCQQKPDNLTVIIATHVPMHPEINRKDLTPDKYSFIFGCDGYEEIVKPRLPEFFEKGVNDIWLLSGHTHGPGFWEDPDFRGKVKLKTVDSDYGDPRTWVLELSAK